MRHIRTYLPIALLLVWGYAAIGCMAFHDDATGKLGIGMAIGTVAETTQQIVGAAVSAIPVVGPILSPVIAGIAAIGLPAAGAFVTKRSADKARAREDAAWDDAKRDAELAHLKRDATWDEALRRRPELAASGNVDTPLVRERVVATGDVGDDRAGGIASVAPATPAWFVPSATPDSLAHR